MDSNAEKQQHGLPQHTAGAPASTSPKASYGAPLKASLVSLLLLAFYLSPYAPAATFTPRWVSSITGAGPWSLGEVVAPAARCPIQHPGIHKGRNWKPMDDPKYVRQAVKNLQGSIQIPTQSYDDMGKPGSEPRFAQIEKLNAYLATTYPLVHSKLQLEKVALYGLFYTWTGRDESLKPLVLMAHQDVVPVNPATEDQWLYPPFSGFQDEDGWIWGRGGADCKNTLIGILAAVEQLLSEGFSPPRTIVMSFGFDEEIGGSRSALPLASHLYKRYGKDGVALILDEGFTGVDDAYGTSFARFGMAEKGAISLEMSVLMPGGHSSVPTRHTAIGTLALLLVELEKYPDIPALAEGNPMLSYLDCAADFGDMDKKTAGRVKDPRQWQSLGEELAEEDDIIRAFLATTQAETMIAGGVKLNALPELATAKINYRISFLSSTTATFERITSILSPLVASLNLTFSISGSHASVANSVVRLDVIKGSEIEPAPLTPAVGPAFELMSGTVKDVWSDAVISPSGMVANTDTKWYWNSTQHIYRFVPASLTQVANFHTVNERVHIDGHLTGIEFFYKLLANTEGWEAE